LNDLLVGWSMVWRSAWLIDWDGLIDWYWLIDLYWMWLIGIGNGWLWLIGSDWLIDCDWLLVIDCLLLIAWLIGCYWLLDWLVEWFVTGSRVIDCKVKHNKISLTVSAEFLVVSRFWKEWYRYVQSYSHWVRAGKGCWYRDLTSRVSLTKKFVR
jgi:Zn-dependent protease with chaperone function